MKHLHTKFISRSDAEKISADPAYYIKFGVVPADTKVALLSFVSPDGFGGSEVTDPKLDAYWHHVFKQRFHDIDPTNCSSAFVNQYQSFTHEQAEALIEFLISIEADVDEVWAHCEAGISRSAAASKYIAYAYGSYFPETYSLYNKHVFTTLVRAHNTRAYDDLPYPGKIHG